MAFCWPENGIPCRYIMTIMSFFGFVFNYMLRININIAVVAMVNYSSIARSNDSGRDCGFNSTDDPYDPADDGPFPWDESLQSTLSGSFFWGYLVFQIPGGRLCDMYGGKWIFGLGIMISGVLNMIFPLLATDSAVYLIAARVCMGLATGATFPGMHAMLSRWAPPLERTRIAAIVYAGCQAGTCIAYPLAGLIVDELGWEYVFYIMGAASLVWGGLWIYLVYDSPSVHPRIDKEELAYLTESIGVVQKKDQPIPWKAIATSMPFWAIMAADLGNNWGFWMLLTELPIYLKNILHYDIKGNSIQSALPYLCMWLFSMFYGAMADVVLQKKWMSRKNIRKWATIHSHLFGAIILVGVANAGCDDILTLVLFNVSVGLQGAIYTGFLTNHMDIAPNFAGTLYGVTNCIASIPSFVAPLTAGAITKGAQTLANWQTVFYISAAWYAGGAIIFAIFADGEIQSWNYYGLKEDPEGNNNEKPSEADKSSPTYNTFNTQVPKSESSAKDFPENPWYSTNKSNLQHDSLDSGSNKRRKFNGSTEKAQGGSGNTQYRI